MIVLVVAVCGGVALVGFSAIRSTWPYTEGVKLAQHNPAVVEELGEPVEGGYFAVVSANMASGGTSSTSLKIPLSGPKGKATLEVVANQVAGKWSFVSAVVTVEKDGKTIDLLKK
jgi:energy-converting hydrogenase Eha subunit B